MNRLAGSNPAPSATHDVVKPASAPIKLDDADLRPAFIRSSALADCRNGVCICPNGPKRKNSKKANHPEHRYKDGCIHPCSIARIGLVTAETRGALASGVTIRD
jgi:hypothetical protein